MSTWFNDSEMILRVDDGVDAEAVCARIREILEAEDGVRHEPRIGGERIIIEMYVDGEEWPSGPATVSTWREVGEVVALCSPGSFVRFFDEDDKLFWKCCKDSDGGICWESAVPVPGEWRPQPAMSKYYTETL